MHVRPRREPDETFAPEDALPDRAFALALGAGREVELGFLLLHTREGLLLHFVLVHVHVAVAVQGTCFALGALFFVVLFLLLLVFVLCLDDAEGRGNQVPQATGVKRAPGRVDKRRDAVPGISAAPSPV